MRLLETGASHLLYLQKLRVVSPSSSDHNRLAAEQGAASIKRDGELRLQGEEMRHGECWELFCLRTFCQRFRLGS